MGKYYEALQMCKQASDGDIKMSDIAGALPGVTMGGGLGGMAANLLSKKTKLGGLSSAANWLLGSLAGGAAGGYGTSQLAKKFREETGAKGGMADTVANLTLPSMTGAAGGLLGGHIGKQILSKVVEVPTANPLVKSMKMPLGMLIGGNLGGIAGGLAGLRLGSSKWSD